MRLWHQKLLPYIDRQRLLSQHRECCALRGKGWGKKHSVVDYVFTHDPSCLVAYHWMVMDEMQRRGYHPDLTWYAAYYRGTTLGVDKEFASEVYATEFHNEAMRGEMIFPEHDDSYLRECIELLEKKGAPVDYPL